VSVSLLALARYTLKGPYQAAAVVGLLAVLAVFIPPMAGNSMFGVVVASLCMLLSCSLVGLVILTHGSISGLKAIAVSMLGITLVAWALIDAPELGFWTGVVQWLPIILLAQALRSTRSLPLTLLAGTALGAIAIAMQYLFWGSIQSEMINQAMLRMGDVGQQEQELVQRNLQVLQLFVLAMVAMVYLYIMLILMVARWMQASLAGSNGFREEFYGLALGKSASLVALLIVGLSVWLEQPWLVSLAFLAVIAFMFQGIAIVHSRFVFPQVVALTSLTGVIDNWLVFRNKSVKPDDENEL